jgi:hypothetical protein
MNPKRSVKGHRAQGIQIVPFLRSRILEPYVTVRFPKISKSNYSSLEYFNSSKGCSVRILSISIPRDLRVVPLVEPRSKILEFQEIPRSKILRTQEILLVQFSEISIRHCSISRVTQDLAFGCRAYAKSLCSSSEHSNIAPFRSRVSRSLYPELGGVLPAWIITKLASTEPSSQQ